MSALPTRTTVPSKTLPVSSHTGNNKNIQFVLLWVNFLNASVFFPDKHIYTTTVKRLISFEFHYPEWHYNSQVTSRTTRRPGVRVTPVENHRSTYMSWSYPIHGTSVRALTSSTSPREMHPLTGGSATLNALHYVQCTERKMCTESGWIRPQPAGKYCTIQIQRR